MQEDTFDYEAVPYHFVHCFKEQCPRAGSCLRYIVGEHCTTKNYFIHVVNPKRIPEDAEKCPYFLSMEKIRVAWGVKKLLMNVPLEKANAMKRQLLAHFGRNAYYRFYRKEVHISPADQEFVRKLFRQYGIAEEPVFDEYTETYNW